MSSDEAGPEKGIFIIRRKVSLSSQISRLVWKMDQFYEQNVTATQKTGGKPHLRVDKGLISTSQKRVKNLPGNCYDHHWYSGLGTSEREGLTNKWNQVYEFEDV